MGWVVLGFEKVTHDQLLRERPWASSHSHALLSAYEVMTVRRYRNMISFI